VKFVLEVDLSGMALEGVAGKDLGRILRYWAGAVQQLELEPGQGSAIYDSAYREVGRWTVTDAPGTETRARAYPTARVSSIPDTAHLTSPGTCTYRRRGRSVQDKSFRIPRGGHNVKSRIRFLTAILTVALGAALGTLTGSPANAAPADDPIEEITIVATESSPECCPHPIRRVITCRIFVHNPHKSSHAPGFINVVSRTQCTAPVASLNGIVGLYRDNLLISNRAARNFSVAALELNTIAPCISGGYHGVGVTDVVFPPGFTPPGGRISNRSVYVPITC